MQQILEGFERFFPLFGQSPCMNPSRSYFRIKYSKRCTRFVVKIIIPLSSQRRREFQYDTLDEQ